MGENRCGMCGLPIHPNESGIRHFGFYVAHSERRCIDLLRSHLESQLAEAKARAGWTCFHCGEHFTDEQCARLHFGRDETSEAACIIKAGAEGRLLKALRQAEEQADDAIQAMHSESTDAAKAYHAQRCRHTQALIAAEEAGYERGLADGQAMHDLSARSALGGGQ